MVTHPFAYCEVHSREPARAREFYAKMFAWKMNDTPIPIGTYTELHPGEGLEGGLSPTQLPGQSVWLVYVRVPDVRRATDQARALGAEVLHDVSEVPNVGWFSILRDPTGAP